MAVSSVSASGSVGSLGYTKGGSVALSGVSASGAVGSLIIFPVQYSGLRVWHGGAMVELCLVAEADAPSGQGGVLKIRKGGANYAAYLVGTANTNASAVRVQTSTGTKSIRIKT